jgi:hypothetical protein
MNARVHPAIAALVIALAFAVLGLWVWAGGKAAAMGGPAQLIVSPSGGLFIQVNNVLLEHDAEGAFLRQHDLAALGVSSLISGIAFFANGDLLLRRGGDPRSLRDKLRAYRRNTNEADLAPLRGGDGLYRCALSSGHCEQFGAEPLDPKAAFSLFIDTRHDDVYLADTSRHVLRKYPAIGAPEISPTGSFAFPNQLTLIDDELYVANTNHHAIDIVNAEQPFGSDIESISMIVPEGRAAGHRWPTHFARIGDDWWVTIMSSKMDYGGVYLFDSAWQYQRRIDLPENADPFAIVPFGGQVLISDWYNDRVHRLTRDGHWLGDYPSDGLTALLKTNGEQRLRWNVVSFSGVAAVAAAFLLLILRALLQADRREDLR